MRDYGKVSPRFWIGTTGRKIRALGPEAQVVALYLLTAPTSSMTGLYYLPLGTLAHETGISIEGASKLLASLFEAEFAHYDESNELVWVPEMARHQLGETLDPKDKRHKGLLRELSHYRKSRFFYDFHDRYRGVYCLPDPGPRPSPFEGPSKPHRSKEKEQEKEIPPTPLSPAAANSNRAGPQLVGCERELRRDPIRHLFDLWRSEHDHQRAQLDKKRRRKLAAGLKSHGFETCRLAILGCKESPFHMGGNADGTLYNDIIQIFRDGPQIEKFAALAPKESPQPAPVVRLLKPEATPDDLATVGELASGFLDGVRRRG